jgi:hypothetical protein
VRDKGLPEDSFYMQEKENRQKLLNQFKSYGYQRRPVNSNRRLLFFDLLLIVVIMGVLYPMIMQRYGPNRWIQGYRYDYRVTLMRNKIIHTLEVEARPDGSQETPVIKIYFNTSDLEEMVPLLDLAPAPGDIRIFTQEEFPQSQPKQAVCTVEIQGETLHFQKNLGRISYIAPFKNIFSSTKLDG